MTEENRVDETVTVEAEKVGAKDTQEVNGGHGGGQAPPYVKYAYKDFKRGHTSTKVVWGVIFVAAAAALILGGIGVLNIDGIGVWDMVWTIILAVIFIFSLGQLFWFGIFFPIAGALLIYGDKFFDMNFPTWPILGGALLLSIGFHIFFSGAKKKRKALAKAKYEAEYGGSWHPGHGTNDGQTYQNAYNHETNAQSDGGSDSDSSSKTYGDSVVRAEASFNNTVKYINSNCLKRAEIECSFSNMDVYFDSAKLADGNAAIIVSVSFGALNLYLPKEWDVTVNVDSGFANVQENNYPNPNVQKTANVVIFGDVSFSGLTVTYI